MGVRHNHEHGDDLADNADLRAVQTRITRRLVRLLDPTLVILMVMVVIRLLTVVAN